MRLLSLVAVFLLIFSTPVNADWINLTGAETAPNIAEITVFDDHVKLALEIYLDDLAVFKELIPDEWLKDSEIQRPTEQERLERFAAERFQVVTDEGEKLPAEVVLIEPRLRKDRKSPFAGMINPYTRQRVPGAPTDKRVVYAEIVYPFNNRPESLTFIPPQDAEGTPEASIGFITYHKSVPVIDFRYLGAPARLLLDWEDPWYSRFDNPNLKRHHKSALMSFLYVEPYEVRHEILVRVKDLEEWMDLGLQDDRYIQVEELEPLKRRIGEFLLTRNALRVDGETLKPILDRVNFVKVGLTGIQLLETPEPLEISTAIVGVIITYLTDGMPRQVTIDWDLFTNQISRVPATATDPAGPLPGFVEPDDNVITWTNYLKNYVLPTVHTVNVKGSLGELRIPIGTVAALLLLIPTGWVAARRVRRGKPVKIAVVAVVSLVVTGAVSYPFTQVAIARPEAVAGDLTNEQARALLRTLLKNVYRAFDFREEEDVYDKLAFSVKGDLLGDIYLQNRKSFSIKRAGGAQARIKEIDILEAGAERLDGGALRYAIRGKWTALGSVGHWGHNHLRKNLYDAIVTVEAEEGEWKITDLDLLEEQRLDQTAQPSKTTVKPQQQTPGAAGPPG